MSTLIIDENWVQSMETLLPYVPQNNLHFKPVSHCVLCKKRPPMYTTIGSLLTFIMTIANRFSHVHPICYKCARVATKHMEKAKSVSMDTVTETESIFGTSTQSISTTTSTGSSSSQLDASTTRKRPRQRSPAEQPIDQSSNTSKDSIDRMIEKTPLFVKTGCRNTSNTSKSRSSLIVDQRSVQLQPTTTQSKTTPVQLSARANLSPIKSKVPPNRSQTASVPSSVQPQIIFVQQTSIRSNQSSQSPVARTAAVSSSEELLIPIRRRSHPLLLPLSPANAGPSNRNTLPAPSPTESPSLSDDDLVPIIYQRKKEQRVRIRKQLPPTRVISNGHLPIHDYTRTSGG